MTRYIAALVLGALTGSFGQMTYANEFKVLVVMSYEEHNPWCKEIREGINSVLASSADVSYFYMDTKVNPTDGPEKAQQALGIYQKIKPNGVITVDDNAQSMFVVPFLKGQVDTPIMFAGVNSDAGKYDYPNSHISGILERAHVRESLAFAKQLLPSIQSACFITNDVASGQALRNQVETEQHNYPVKVSAFHLVKSVSELDSLKDTLRSSCDTLFVDSLEGVLSQEQTPLDNKQVLGHLNKLYSGPILGGNRYQVEQGAWAAVVKTGQEQGVTAAEMLLQAMQGTPVSPPCQDSCRVS